jgi:hypothetical protein
MYSGACRGCDTNWSQVGLLSYSKVEGNPVSAGKGVGAVLGFPVEVEMLCKTKATSSALTLREAGPFLLALLLVLLLRPLDKISPLVGGNGIGE